MGLAVFFITGTHMFGYPSGQIVATCTTVIVTAKRDQKAFDCFAPLLERLDESWRIHYWYCMILYCIEAMFSQLRRVSKVFHNFFIWQLFESSWRLRYWRTDIIFAFTTCKISLGWLLAGRFWHFCSVHRASWQTALLLRASHPWSADSLGYCCPSSTLLREPPDSKHFEMPLLYFHFMLILKLSWGNFLIRDLDGKSAVAQTDRVPFGLKCFTPVLKDIRKIWSNVSHSMSLLAWKCVQPSVAYRTTWSMSEKSELICSQGDSFFGKSLTASDGSKWLCNEANGLFLPLVHPETKKQMFEEQCWECVFKGTVKGRKTPEISDVSETMVKSGTTRSTLAGCWRQRTSCTIPWITQTLLPSSSNPRHPIQPLWEMSSMPMIWRTVTSFSRMMTLHVSRLPRDWVCAFLWLAVSRFVWQLPTTQKVPSAESGATLRAPWLRALSQLFCCTKSWPITPWADAWGQAIILMLDGDTSDRSAGHPCQFN